MIKGMAPPWSWNSTEEEAHVESVALIPGLPNDLSALILAFLPYSHHSRLKSVCISWKRFFSSKTLISHRLGHLPFHVRSHLLCIFPQDLSNSSPHLFDPENLAWCPLPHMPCNPKDYVLCNFTSVSVGAHLFVLGGSLFDTRFIPLDRSFSKSAVFRFSFSDFSWESLSPMLAARGSFACAVVPDTNKIVVAGGGSRHPLFGRAGSRMSSVEMYDIEKDEWVALDGLPRFRAGCVGFVVGTGDEREFWVMGGYDESRTIQGQFPMDEEYYRDAVVMELKNGGRWRNIGDMWNEEERKRPGKIVVIEDGTRGVPAIFMLDGSDILKYDISSNRWAHEASVPRQALNESSVGFVAVDGELYVMTLLIGLKQTDLSNFKQHRRPGTILLQIYNPKKTTWRYIATKPPFPRYLNFKTAVMSTVCL